MCAKNVNIDIKRFNQYIRRYSPKLKELCELPYELPYQLPYELPYKLPYELLYEVILSVAQLVKAVIFSHREISHVLNGFHSQNQHTYRGPNISAMVTQYTSDSIGSSMTTRKVLL